MADAAAQVREYHKSSSQADKMRLVASEIRFPFFSLLFTSLRHHVHRFLPLLLYTLSERKGHGHTRFALLRPATQRRHQLCTFIGKQRTLSAARQIDL